MESEVWPLNGLYHESLFSVWDQSSAAICGPVDEYVASLHATAWTTDYGGDDLYSGFGGDYEKMDVDPICVVPAEQHVFDELPVSLEDGQFTHRQFVETIPLLQGSIGINPLAAQCIELPGYAVQSIAEDKYAFVGLISPQPTVAIQPLAFEGAAFPKIERKPCHGVEENVMDMLAQLCDTFDGDMFIDQTQLSAFDSILPPMSPEDVESLLSSQPPSLDVPVLSTSSSSSSLSSLPSVHTPPSSPTSSQASPSQLSGITPPVEKKVRKKEQNKTAALRYRHKKRDEQGTVLTEYEVLEKRNIELKTKVTEMTKEIDYLKGLIEEICA